MVTAGVVTWRPSRLDGLYRRAGQLELNKDWSCVCDGEIHQSLFLLSGCEFSPYWSIWYLGGGQFL